MAAGADAWWRRAEEELRAARILHESAFAVQAYFHAGQAVEFGLKAIYLRRRNLREMPGYARGARWHNLAFLAEQAGLDGDLTLLRRQPDWYSAWLRVETWDSSARYPGNAPSRGDMAAVLSAVGDNARGVMTWLGTIFRET
jgi:HEPN domain-containing protein